MATFIAKMDVLLLITAVCTSYKGTHSTVETPEFIDIVTVSGSSIHCTCKQADCEHIRFVERRCIQDAMQSARRSAYTELFDLSYGDISSVS